MSVRWLIVAIVLLTATCGRKGVSVEAPIFSQKLFVTRQAILGSQQFKYRVYVPNEINESGRLPVMLYLHGSDERGNDNEGQLSGPAPAILANPENFKFIIVFPQCPKGRFWDEEIIHQAILALDQTVSEFNGDSSKLYLAGFSLGGYGAWTTAAMYPNKFAAVVPMSGRVMPRPGERKSVAPEILRLVDSKEPYLAFAEKLSSTPIWIFHGANDNIVPVYNSRQMAKALNEAGNINARYTELENTGHVSLTAAFNDRELFEWLAYQKLKN